MIWIAMLYMPHAMMNVQVATQQDCQRILAAHRKMWGGSEGTTGFCIQVRR